MELSRVNKLALLLVSILCVSLIIYVLILRQNSASNIDSLEQDIQYLTKKNEQLRGAYYGSSIEELQIKVRKQKDMIDDLMAGRCGEYYCWDIVWFMDIEGINTGRVILSTNDEIKLGVIWAYWIVTEEHYLDPEYIGMDYIIPIWYLYKTKEELMLSLK